MKTLALLILSILAAAAAEYVPAYIDKDGNLRGGYWRTERNSTKLDNYSTKGNTNPWTNEKGSKSADPVWMRPSSGTYVEGYYRKDGTYVPGHYRR
jgi:hypothetical protein